MSWPSNFTIIYLHLQDNETALDRTTPAKPETLPYNEHDVLGRTRDESEMYRSRSPTICFDDAPSASRGSRERTQDGRPSLTRYSHRLRDRLDVDAGDGASRQPDGQPPRKKQATATEMRDRLGVFQQSPSARNFKYLFLTALASNAVNSREAHDGSESGTVAEL